MSTIVIHGIPGSPYVRMPLLACEGRPASLGGRILLRADHFLARGLAGIVNGAGVSINIQHGPRHLRSEALPKRSGFTAARILD